MKINEWPRHAVQALWAALTNSHISGFVTGKIYTGKLKNVCVPGLNCYSCPGARGACPIGSLQAVSEGISDTSQGYVSGMETLNRNISGLNTIYEIQLKSISSQLDNIDRVNNGLKNIRDMSPSGTCTKQIPEFLIVSFELASPCGSATPFPR